MRDSSGHPKGNNVDDVRELFELSREIASLRFKLTTVLNENFYLAMKLFALSSRNKLLGGNGAKEEILRIAERYMQR
ncbi:hypothetical protein [Thermococcus prieurii]